MRNYKTPLFAKRHMRLLAGVLHRTKPAAGCSADEHVQWQKTRDEIVSALRQHGSMFDSGRFANAVESGKECD